MNKITRNDNTDFEIEVKRFYIPFTIHSNCPRCDRPHSVDLEDQYLSYPVVGEPVEVYFGCEEGDCYDDGPEWEVKVIVSLDLGLVNCSPQLELLI